MQLSAVVLARFIAFLETYDLNPKGSAFFPDIAVAIVKKFRFQKFPQTFSEMDEQKGVDFLEGYWDGVVVDKFTIFQGGLVVDTRASTADSERILDETLIWATTQFGLRYDPKMVNRKRYLSYVTFYSTAPLLTTHPAVSRLARLVSQHMGEIIHEPIPYSPFRLDIDFDRTNRPIQFAPFNIQRRSDTPFSENKYYSEAPLPTDVHIKLLEQFESDLSST